MKYIIFLNAPSTTSRIVLEPLTSQIRGFEFFPRELKMKTLLSEMEYDTCKFISDGSELRSLEFRKRMRIRIRRFYSAK